MGTSMHWWVRSRRAWLGLRFLRCRKLKKGFFVKDADFDDTLFAKLGHMDGLKKIVNSAFQNIMEDRSLAKFYQGSNLNIIK